VTFRIGLATGLVAVGRTRDANRRSRESHAVRGRNDRRRISVVRDCAGRPDVDRIRGDRADRQTPGLIHAQRCPIADRGIDAQHVVRVAFRHNDVARLNVAEFGLADAEALGDLGQKLHLARMQHLVSLGDVE